MIKQITIILSCALLGIGLACTNSDDRGGGQTCRSTSVLPGDSFLCIESTPCRIIGAKPGTCESIPTCSISSGEDTQVGTDTAYMCTGTPPE